MNKKSIISFLLSFSLCTSALLANSLQMGWGLYGFSSDVNMTQTYTSDSSVKIVWKYTNGSWYAYSPDSSINTQLDNISQAKFELLPTGEGVWIYSTQATTDTATLQKSLATTLVLGADGLSAAGLGSGGGISGITSSMPTLSSSGTLAKTLSNTITPTFDFNTTTGIYSGSMTILGTTATVTFNILDGTSSILDTAIMDSTNTDSIFGISSIEALGNILAATPTDPSAAQQYISDNATSIITYITTYSSSPAYSYLNQNFQDFSLALATAISNSDISSISTLLGDTSSLTNLSVDWGRLAMDMKVEFSGPLSIGSISVNLNPLISDRITLATSISAIPVTFNSSGTIYANDFNITMNNVEINTTMGNPNVIVGKYDINETIDGKEITGTATFNENGCQGADIYADGVFFSRVKLESDGNLYLVDENNQKIDTTPLNSTN